MNKIWLACIVVVYWAAQGFVFGQSNTSPANAGVRLETGIAKEEADGDLKAAIRVYQQIAGDSSAPRAVRAKALLRLARCDEKLGQQARQVYEQIVRDYADQPVAVQARTRLEALRRQDSPAMPTTMTARRIDWHSIGQMAASDTDGQRAVYRDASGSLYFGDLAGHTKRLIWKLGAKDRIGWVPSRDFTLVALILPGKENPGSATIAVVKTDGTGYRELMHDDAEGIAFFNLGFNIAWSWDNHFLVVSSVPEDGGGRIVVVSVADGKYRELANAQYTANRFSKAMISPDGQFVAYEEFAKAGNRLQIFVTPIRGGDRQLVYEPTPSGLKPYLHPSLLDWTIDGQDLVISDIRGLNSGVFLLPMKNGKATGDPQIMRQGGVADGYTTPAGTLVVQDLPTQYGLGSPFFLTSMDAGGHIAAWSRLKAESGDATGLRASPSFSPDSKEIAYVMRSDRIGDLVVHNLADGRDRMLYSSKEFLICKYGNHSATVFCTEFASNGQTNILSISAIGGEVQRLGVVREFALILGLDQDDRILYLGTKLADTSGTVRNNVVKLDMGSWQETLMYQLPDKDESTYFVSAKCNWLLRKKGGEIFARPMAGGDWKVLTSIKGITLQGPFATTSDEKWMVYNCLDATGKGSLFRTPIAGGQPELLGDFPHPYQDSRSYLQISPDGEQILAELPNREAFDLWVLSNFLPKH